MSKAKKHLKGMAMSQVKTKKTMADYGLIAVRCSKAVEQEISEMIESVRGYVNSGLDTERFKLAKKNDVVISALRIGLRELLKPRK